jgi:hypothetical protein
MSKIDELVKEASELPGDQQLTLARRVLAAAEPPPTSEVEQAWDFAIRERIRNFDQGKTKSRPASAVFADLDRRLGS